MSDMKILAPLAVTAGMLTSSSIAEPAPGEASWSSGTNYAIAAEVISTSTHRKYRAVQASGPGSGGAVDPTTDTDASHWLNIGPTNRWAMFDQSVGSISSKSGGFNVELVSSGANAVALLEVDAASVGIYVQDEASQTVYSRQIDMTFGGNVGDWYDYFFAPIIRQREVVVTDLPVYLAGKIIVEIVDNSTAECGVLALGTATRFGSTLYGARAGIIDYSRKDTDAFGVTSIVQRSYAKRSTMQVQVPGALTDYLMRYLSDYRATPLVFIGAEGVYGVLLLYGFAKDFEIDIAQPTVNYCSLTVEGLT